MGNYHVRFGRGRLEKESRTTSPAAYLTVIEIMILRETILATQMELFANKDRWQEVKEFYLAKAELQQFIAEIEAGKMHQALPPVTTEVAESETKELPPPKDNPATDLLKELNEHLRGKENRPFPMKEKGE
mgnify:CR=1 FL=1